MVDDISSFVRTDYKAVDKHDAVHSIMGYVTGDSDKVPVVLDGKHPYGILNERALMSRRLDGNAKIEGFVLTTRAVPPETPVDEAIARMAEYRAPYLPVERQGKLAGYVSAIDLVRQQDLDYDAGEMCVPILTLTTKQSLSEALHAFNKEYVDHLPVVDEKGRVVGVIGRRFIINVETQLGSKGRKDANGEKVHLLAEPLEGFIEQPPVTVAPNADFETVLEAVEEHGYAIVQASDGAIQGIITPQTLVRNP